MPEQDLTRTARALQEVPLAEMVKKTAVAIIQSQAELDRTAIALTQFMGDPAHGIEINNQRRSLLELGFYPSFYQFTEVTIEFVVTIKVAESEEFKIGGKLGGAIPIGRPGAPPAGGSGGAPAGGSGAGVARGSDLAPAGGSGGASTGGGGGAPAGGSGRTPAVERAGGESPGAGKPPSGGPDASDGKLQDEQLQRGIRERLEEAKGQTDPVKRRDGLKTVIAECDAAIRAAGSAGRDTKTFEAVKQDAETALKEVPETS
jgi:hypothetical protein